jgi:UDP-N-acetylglucosamine 2-epimerase (non-hydrolysing)
VKILSVVGARPNFMKVAPIIVAIREHNSRVARDGAGRDLKHVLVHTGQHYDQQMSDSFFTDLNMPAPDVHLGVGSGSHAVQTAEIMRRFEAVLLDEKPDTLIVVGDVNSTIGCALVASKISFDKDGKRPAIVHVESGLRSFDRSMPEEINRILTDNLSDLLFVTEPSGLHNLAQEGIASDKIHFVGNTMIDSLLAYKKKAEASTILEELGLRDVSGAATPYALLTLHRPANVDNSKAFSNILDGLSELIEQYAVVFPAHPRTKSRIQEFGFEKRFQWDREAGSTTRTGAIIMSPPLGYIDFLQLMKNATLVVTDSGGIQEETTCLGIPCVTLRENTERPVTISGGTNILAGVKREGIRNAVRQQLQLKPTAAVVPEKWDGKSASRILEIILREVATADEESATLVASSQNF